MAITPSDLNSEASNLAADVIREKVARMYDAEPNATQEEIEAKAASHRSKHQQYIYNLSKSGKDLATVQTEWHNYYLSLPEPEKHEVWQEFYAGQAAVIRPPQTVVETAHSVAEHKHKVVLRKPAKPRSKRRLAELRSPQAIQATIRETVTAGGTLTAKHHLQSLLFGLGMGAVVVVIFLFSFFNEVIIAPFIQPSRVSAATPLIVSANSVAASKNPEVIIPKINVEIPVNYDEQSTDESVIENDLQGGIVHYPGTVKPGENGNSAFFGHSSNNIFSPGKYKFAFVLLHTMLPGDTFYLAFNSKVYVYKVISKTVVDPSDVGVLGPVPGETATATLITCDPPGTSLRRLVLVGQQISPSVTSNTTPAQTNASVPAPAVGLPGNGPKLFNRLASTSLGKIAIVLTVIALLFVLYRWMRQL